MNRISNPEKWCDVGKDKITVYLKQSEYDYLENLAKLQYKDSRQILGVVKTYALIKFYSKMNPAQLFVPIRSEMFRNGISAKNYKTYLTFLTDKSVIEVKHHEIEVYTDVANHKHIKSTSSNRYRILLLEFQYQKKLFPDSNEKQFPVSICLSKEEIIPLRIKYKAIMEGKENGFQTDKLDTLMNIPDNEAYVMSLVIKLIKDVYCEKVNSQSRFDRRIRMIAKQDKSNESLKTKEYKYSVLVYKVLISLYQIKKKEKRERIEHIVSNYLDNSIDNQLVRWQEERRNENWKLGYYTDLSVDYEGLDHCVSMTDLYHIARINEIPKYTYPSKKLYSKLASLRRSIRKYVRYKDFRLVEVSDIHSAHFTFLPLIFQRCNISVSQNEINRFKQITQYSDLYSEAVKNTSFTREEIKPTFQAFFSIKNEKMFLYNKPEWERQKRQIICDYFHSAFPEIYSALLSFHCSQSMTIKSVANEVESSIMNSICDMIRENGLHPFRIHDAIYLSEDESKLLKLNISQLVFSQINNPDLMNKIITPKTANCFNHS